MKGWLIVMMKWTRAQDKKWTRPQDWAALIAGLYALVSPIWTTSTSDATTAMIVLGIVTAIVAVWSLAMPGAVIPDGLVALLGVLFFISPWVLGFETVTAMAWTAWVVGVVTFVAGLAALPESRKIHQSHVSAQH